MKNITKKLMLSSLLLPGTILLTSELNSVNAESLMEVTASTLNVRSAANSTSSIVDWLKKGQVVKVISDGKSFDYVEYEDGKRGYVSDSYLKQTTVTSYKVNTYSLTVRSGAGVSYKALDYLSKGTQVTILSNASNGWSKISYNNKTGYVKTSYLTKQTGTVKSTSNNSTTLTKKSISSVSASTLTLRNGPSVNNKAIGYLPKKTQLEILSNNNLWVKVRVTKTGQVGYVNSNYVTKPVTVTASNSSTAVTKSTTTSTANKKASTSVIKYVVSSDGLNLRSGRGVSNKLILNIPYGAQISVTNIQNGWGQVTYSGKTGYLNVSYTSDTKTKPVTTKTSTSTTSSKSLKGKLIVIDPGHGGQFAGAQGIVHEEDTNLSIALKTKSALEQMGAVVVMTRISDTACSNASYNADLICRPAIATKLKADAFVSIHANSGAASAYGAESYYYNSSRGDKVLATDILKEIVEEAGMRSRKTAYGNFSVLRNSTVPSALIETGFVTNSSDAAKLGSASYQNKFAKAISEGIQKFFK